MNAKHRLILAGIILLAGYTFVRLHSGVHVAAMARGEFPSSATVTEWKTDIEGKSSRDITYGNFLYTASSRQFRHVDTPEVIDVDPRLIRYTPTSIGSVVALWSFFLAMMLSEAASRLFTRKPTAYTPAAT